MNKVLQRSIKAAGSAAALARILGLSPSTVQRWARNGVPETQRELLERHDQECKASRGRKHIKPKEQSTNGARDSRRSFVGQGSKVPAGERLAVHEHYELTKTNEREPGTDSVEPAMTHRRRRIQAAREVMRNIAENRPIPPHKIRGPITMRMARRLHKTYAAGSIAGPTVSFKPWAREQLSGVQTVGRLFEILH